MLLFNGLLLDSSSELMWAPAAILWSDSEESTRSIMSNSLHPAKALLPPWESLLIPSPPPSLMPSSSSSLVPLLFIFYWRYCSFINICGTQHGSGATEASTANFCANQVAMVHSVIWKFHRFPPSAASRWRPMLYIFQITWPCNFLFMGLELFTADGRRHITIGSSLAAASSWSPFLSLVVHFLQFQAISCLEAGY